MPTSAIIPVPEKIDIIEKDLLFVILETAL
jgi:hypothetical protein